VKGDTAGAVYKQLSKNFPPEAIAWVKDVKWTGPTDVPADKFDTDDYDSWATSHQPEKVAHFQRKIRDGEDVNPVVAVHTPKDPRVKIVDGHHRFTAHRGLGKDTPAYIGQVPEKVGPWTETHSYQIHQGEHPANKADAVRLIAAGLLVLARDTGRVLMIQRAKEDDADNAGGKWELPGGRLDDGEMPLDAALREWKEETGLELPEGKVQGTWLSPDGVYRGYVWVTDHEQDVEHLGEREPDPDGDHMEALAWWEPGMLKGNSAVRQEIHDSIELLLSALAFATTAAGGKK
jgi:8-oxo-dGTP pyrophosphatase MutT (NUDIX family)